MSYPYTSAPAATPPAPPKKGMSGCAIAAIIVGILLVIMIGIATWAFFAFKDNISTDPVKVNAMADQIAEIDLGDKWEPQLSMDIFIVRMALYISTDRQGVAVLMDGDSKMGTGEQFETQMRAEMEKNASQHRGSIEQTTQISSGRQELTIRGKPHKFLVVNSEGVDSKKKYLEVSGTFESAEQGRTAFLMIKAPEESFSMAEVEAAVESIK